MGFVYFLIALAALFINIVVASEFAGIAEMKGHNRRRYWHFCFWFGFIGYFMVIALPDRKPIAIQSLETSPPTPPGKPAKPAADPARGDLSSQLPEL